MRKHFILSALTSSILFLGCSNPTALEHFNKGEYFSQALQYTKKSDIIQKNEVIAMMSATYLNAVSSKYQHEDYENFIVSIYISEEKKKLIDSSFSLTLNEVMATQVKELDKDSIFVKQSPLKNPWAKYFSVRFPKKQIQNQFDEDLTYKERIHNKRYSEISLKFTHSVLGSTTVNFLREY